MRLGHAEPRIERQPLPGGVLDLGGDHRVGVQIAQGAEAGDVRSDVNGNFEATAFLAFLDGLRLQYFYADGAVSLTVNLCAYVDQLVARISIDT